MADLYRGRRGRGGGMEDGGGDIKDVEEVKDVADVKDIEDGTGRT